MVTCKKTTSRFRTPVPRSGLRRIPRNRLVKAVADLLQATVPARFKVAADPVALSEVEIGWSKDDSSRRTVFTVDEQRG